jgi:hypothetical protein
MVLLLICEMEPVFETRRAGAENRISDGGHIPLADILLVTFPPIGEKPIDVKIAASFRGDLFAVCGVLSTVQLA